MHAGSSPRPGTAARSRRLSVRVGSTARNMVMGRGALEGAMALGRSRERRPRALERATPLGRFLIPRAPGNGRPNPTAEMC